MATVVARSSAICTFELAVDALELADHVDQIVLLSGDGDFRPLAANALNPVIGFGPDTS
jgi:uncharacterized LabA/DUF88 family protein